MRRIRVLSLGLLFLSSVALMPRGQAADARLKPAFRRPEKDGWIFVHLEGSPRDVGYQHGYLLAPEIAAAR